MFYKMLFDRFVDFAYLYTVLDMPRQIRIVCLYNVSVLCFVNNGLADKTSTEPGLPNRYETGMKLRSPDEDAPTALTVVLSHNALKRVVEI